MRPSGIDKRMFYEFLDMMVNEVNDKKTPITREEIESYAETFTEYLNFNINETKRKAKSVVIGPPKLFKLAKYIGGKYIASLLVYILLAVLIIVLTISTFKVVLNSNGDTFIYVVSICAYILFTLGILSVLASNTRRLFYKYKNTSNLSVNGIYVFDINGLSNPRCTKAQQYHGCYHGGILTYTEESKATNHVISPTYVQITHIDSEYVYIIDLDTLVQYKLDIDYSFLLYNLTKSPNNVVTFIRYPDTLPQFTDRDVKIIEAAAILAHHYASKNDNKTVYKEIMGLMSKIRFYSEEAYSGVYNEEKDFIDNSSMYDNIFKAFNYFRNKTEGHEEDEDEEDDDGSFTS